VEVQLLKYELFSICLVQLLIIAFSTKSFTALLATNIRQARPGNLIKITARGTNYWPWEFDDFSVLRMLEICNAWMRSLSLTSSILFLNHRLKESSSLFESTPNGSVLGGWA